MRPMSSMNPRIASAVYISSRLCRSAWCTWRVKGVSAVGHVIHLCRQSGSDQSRHLAQIARKPSSDSVVDRRAVRTPGVAHQCPAVRCVACDRAQECQCRILRLSGEIEGCDRALFRFRSDSPQLRGLGEDQRGVQLASHRQRLRTSDIHDRVACPGGRVGVRESPDPTPASRRRSARRCARSSWTRSGTGSDRDSRILRPQPACRPLYSLSKPTKDGWNPASSLISMASFLRIPMRGRTR